MLEKRGEIPAAIAEFELALQLDPTFVPAIEGLRRAQRPLSHRQIAVHAFVRPDNKLALSTWRRPRPAIASG